MRIFYSPRCLEYGTAGHPESPERIRRCLEMLKHHTDWQWVEPTPCTEADILRAHSPVQIFAVKTGDFYDVDTPNFPNIFELALLSAGAACGAAEAAWAGEPAFSLMRPPGHHAERERVMGFCYFNNIAVAVSKLLERAKRAAIFDFDCHHGNGTEDIFYSNQNVLFCSLHQSPCYPGTGLESRGNCLNFPLPPGTKPDVFLQKCDAALEKIADFSPEIVAVSAGFDAFKRDPITDMALEIETFGEIGRKLRAFPRVFAVLEGGYSSQLGKCVDAFLSGWVGAQP
jgi:acetoin utilization deacetylase AcuC-like enzyme